jgi:hypothetical protein
VISGFEVQYSLNGQDGEAHLEKLAVALERLGDGITDFSEFIWPKVVKDLEEEERRQFAAEGQGPGRGSWAPLSPAYAEQKAKDWPGKPILERTSALREALTNGSASGARRISTRDSFDFGTSGIEHASFHQVGTSNMTDRPPFDMGTEFERDVTESMKAGMREAMKRSGADEYLTETGP